MAKVVVLEQKWLYLGKSGCNRAEVVVYVQIGCMLVRWLYSGKKCLYSGKRGCIRAKVVVFG